MAAIISNAVLTKCILIALGYYIGRYLDQKYGTDPLFMLSLIVVALSVGVWWIVRLGNRMKF